MFVCYANSHLHSKTEDTIVVYVDYSSVMIVVRLMKIQK